MSTRCTVLWVGVGVASLALTSLILLSPDLPSEWSATAPTPGAGLLVGPSSERDGFELEATLRPEGPSGEPGLVKVLSGPAAQPVDTQPGARAMLRGEVVGARGPLGGAFVWVTRPGLGSRRPLATSVAAPDGRFSLPVEAEGDLWIHARAPGHVVLRDQAVRPGESPRLQLGSLLTLRAQVEGGGDSVAVTLRSLDRPRSRVVSRVFEPGRLLMVGDLEPGRYELRADDEALRIDPSELTLTRDTTCRLQLSRRSQPLVEVVLPDGAPAAGALVFVEGARHERRICDATGRVTLPAGAEAFTVRLQEFAAQRFEAPFPSERRVDLRVGATLVAHLQDGSGAPLSGATLALVARDGSDVRNGFSDEAGCVTVRGLSAGSWDAVVSSEGGQQTRAVEVAASGQQVLRWVVAAPQGELVGQVESRGGFASHALVLVHPLEAGAPDAYVEADAQGNFRHQQLTPGTYEVSVEGATPQQVQVVSGRPVTVRLIGL